MEEFFGMIIQKCLPGIKMILKMVNLVTSLKILQSCYASHDHGCISSTVLVEELPPDLKTISNLPIGSLDALVIKVLTEPEHDESFKLF